MRNISFALTTQQIRDRTKTVTRRRGTWWSTVLKPGDVLCAVEKSQGIKRGGLVRLGTIRVVSVRTELLLEILADKLNGYDNEESAREGFPMMDGHQFVRMFRRHMGGPPDQSVTRIEFEYIHCGCSHADVEHGDTGCDFCPCAASRFGFHRFPEPCP